MTHHPKTDIFQAGPPGGGLASDQGPGRRSAEDSRTRALIFLRAITDNLGEGTYALDTHGCVTFMNPAAERMLGWTEAELRGKEMHQAIHFQHADGTPFPSAQCPLLRVIRTGQIERVEDDTFTRRDGTLLAVAYVSSPIVIDGQITGAVLAFHDISAHQALDEALRRSERDAAARAGQLLAIFESMADAVLVYDRDGNIVQTNRSDAAFFGSASPPEVSARTIEQRDRLFTYLDEHGQPLPAGQGPIGRVLRGDVLRGASAVDLIVQRNADGHQIVLNASGAPIRDETGAIAGGVLIGRDVTQRRHLEQQTHEALTALMAMAEALVSGDERSTEGVLANAPGVGRRLAELTRAVMNCERVGIITFNFETQFIHTLAVAGLTREQEHLWTYTSRLNDPPEIVERLQAGELVTIDRSVPPYDSLPNPFGSRAMLLVPMTVGGPLLGVITVDYGAERHALTEDEYAMAGAVARLAAQLIERERLARDREIARANALALSETTRRMDEFLSIAAHELRTPVTNGRLSVTLAADTLAGLAAQAAAHQDARAATLAPIAALLERANGHMERLSRLVVDLLDVSRIRAGKLELRLAPCDLAQLVREVVVEQRQTDPGRVVRLQLPAAAHGQTMVLADADRIRQVVSNLLSNALKYSSADQLVVIQVRMDGGWARVSVRDEGPGVPASERRLVWERFYRVQGTPVLSGTGIGLGLGLHISKTIVQQHDGRIGLRSAHGQGSIFWFALELIQTAAPS